MNLGLLLGQLSDVTSELICGWNLFSEHCSVAEELMCHPWTDGWVDG